HAVLEGEVVVLGAEHAPVEQVEIEALARHVLDEGAVRHEVEDVGPADAEVGHEQDRRAVAAARGVPVEPRLVALVDLLARRQPRAGLGGRGELAEVGQAADVAVQLLLPLLDDLGGRGGAAGREPVGEPLHYVREALLTHRFPSRSPDPSGPGLGVPTSQYRPTTPRRVNVFSRAAARRLCLTWLTSSRVSWRDPFRPSP